MLNRISPQRDSEEEHRNEPYRLCEGRPTSRPPAAAGLHDSLAAYKVQQALDELAQQRAKQPATPAANPRQQYRNKLDTTSGLAR